MALLKLNSLMMTFSKGTPFYSYIICHKCNFIQQVIFTNGVNDKWDGKSMCLACARKGEILNRNSLLCTGIFSTAN